MKQFREGDLAVKLQVVALHGDHKYTVSDGSNEANVCINEIIYLDFSYGTRVRAVSEKNTIELALFAVYEFKRRFDGLQTDDGFAFIQCRKPPTNAVVPTFDFRIIDGKSLIDFGIKRPVNAFVLFSSEKRLAAGPAKQAWDSLSEMEKLPYVTKASQLTSDADTKLQEAYEKHGVQRKRVRCMVCSNACDTVLLNASACSNCDLACCSECFIRYYTDTTYKKPSMQMLCFNCNEPMALHKVNTFIHNGFFQKVTMPGWKAAAEAEDAQHMTLMDQAIDDARLLLIYLDDVQPREYASNVARYKELMRVLFSIQESQFDGFCKPYWAYATTVHVARHKETGDRQKAIEEATESFIQRMMDDTDLTKEEMMKEVMSPNEVTFLKIVECARGYVCKFLDDWEHKESVTGQMVNNMAMRVATQAVMEPQQAADYSRIFKCPVGTCPCMLKPEVGSSTVTCIGCTNTICTACQVQVEDMDDHECNPETLKSLREISRSSKPCPNCGVQIFRSSGCPQMFCTGCKMCVFDWDTGLPVAAGSAIHNPHVFQLTQAERDNLMAALNHGVTVDLDNVDLLTLPLTSNAWTTVLTSICKPDYVENGYMAKATSDGAHFGQAVTSAARELRDIEQRVALSNRVARIQYMMRVSVSWTHNSVYLIEKKRYYSMKKFVVKHDHDMEDHYKKTIVRNFAKKRNAEEKLAYFHTRAQAIRKMMCDWCDAKKISEYHKSQQREYESEAQVMCKWIDTH